MKRNPLIKIILVVLAIMVLGYAVYMLPPVNDQLSSWRLDNLRAKIIYTFNPPEQNVFVPQQEAGISSDIPAVVEAPDTGITQAAVLPPTETPVAQTTTAAHVPSPSPAPHLTSTPLPEKVVLQGVVHEYQKWNNCGPSNLAMLLSYWKWQGTQLDTAAVLKPNPRDNNVSMTEMAAYVEQHTRLKPLLRVGGSQPLLKSLLAAGYPLMVEKGIIHNKEWMGHYQTITGYDDQKGAFIAQDSLITPDLPVPYKQLEEEWRVFDNVYLVLYPSEKEAELKALIGPGWDEQTAFNTALSDADKDAETLSGRDLAFAWFNIGTNLVGLKDYAGAAQAYDKYFNLYSSLPKDQRPWRMMWYQNGPYEAYYQTGRYKDVISLASVTLSGLTEKLLEEACTWRALAKEKNGDLPGALTDLQEALKRNPNYAPAKMEYERLQGLSGSGAGTAMP